MFKTVLDVNKDDRCEIVILIVTYFHREVSVTGFGFNGAFSEKDNFKFTRILFRDRTLNFDLEVTMLL